MNNLVDSIRRMSVGVEYANHELREICPKCGGGHSKEVSLALTIDDRGYLLWHCHRASCGFSGRRMAWGALQPPPPKPKKPYTGFTGLLAKEQQDWLMEKFQITPTTASLLDFRNNLNDSRMFIPVRGPAREERGCILRAWQGVEPKVLTFKERLDEPFMGWNRPTGRNGPPVVVEDCFSAAKLYQSGIPSVFLAGTHMGLDKVRELVASVTKIILALDADAFDKAIAYSVQYRHLLEIEVWNIDRDLKYWPEEELRASYFR